MLLFLENDRDSLEHRKKEVPDIEEKLDTLKNRLTLEETKLRMEGKNYFLAGAGKTSGQQLWLSFS